MPILVPGGSRESKQHRHGERHFSDVVITFTEVVREEKTVYPEALQRRCPIRAYFDLTQGKIRVMPSGFLLASRSPAWDGEDRVPHWTPRDLALWRHPGTWLRSLTFQTPPRQPKLSLTELAPARTGPGTTIARESEGSVMRGLAMRQPTGGQGQAVCPLVLDSVGQSVPFRRSSRSRTHVGDGIIPSFSATVHWG